MVPLTQTQREAAVLLKEALLKEVEREGAITLATECKVQWAIPLLRSGHGDAHSLSRAEAISCAIARMQVARREGRVNAYASTLLRLRRAAQAL